MDKPMSGIYRKQFASRYEHIREQQILEYLGQRQGPVPPVVLSHSEEGYLDMRHGGTNLQQWLSADKPSARTALQVLACALSALIKTAQLDVWHIDIALRNFVVQDHPPQKTIWLIDFGNAICPHFALQKPLWMLPHSEQHPNLQEALIQDWQDFYKRHNLPQPPDWHTPFDVSKQVYDNDWTHGLNVESLPLKWCITAHGTGKILLEAASLIPECQQELQRKFVGLLNLQNESHAQVKMQTCLDDLQKASATRSHIEESPTPRPRIASQATDHQRFSTSTASQPAVLQPSISHQTTPVQPILIDTRKSTLVAGWWLNGLSVGLIALGWWILDVGYTAQSQAISWLTVVVASAAMVSFLIVLLGCLWNVHKTRWWVWSLWLQTAGQWILAFELWIFGMPMSSMWAMVLAPATVMVALMFTERHHTRRAMVTDSHGP